jgi:hypothetical protein
MSEFPSIDSALGIIGTVTGIIALFISYWTLKKEKPHLKVEIEKCEHDYEDKNKTLSFWSDFLIKNLGDRGTSILGIDLTFEDGEKKYELEMEHYGPLFESDVKRHGWIHPHETVEYSQTTHMQYEGDKKERINCTLVIYHTHGADSVKVVSERRKQ